MFTIKFSNQDVLLAGPRSDIYCVDRFALEDVYARNSSIYKEMKQSQNNVDHSILQVTLLVCCSFCKENTWYLSRNMTYNFIHPSCCYMYI